MRLCMALQLVAATLAGSGCVLHIERELAPPPEFQYERPTGAPPPFDTFAIPVSSVLPLGSRAMARGLRVTVRGGAR